MRPMAHDHASANLFKNFTKSKDWYPNSSGVQMVLKRNVLKDRMLWGMSLVGFSSVSELLSYLHYPLFKVLSAVHCGISHLYPVVVDSGYRASEEFGYLDGISDPESDECTHPQFRT